MQECSSEWEVVEMGISRNLKMSGDKLIGYVVFCFSFVPAVLALSANFHNR